MQMYSLFKKITCLLIASLFLLTSFSYATTNATENIYKYFSTPIAKEPSVVEAAGTIGGLFQYIGFFGAIITILITGIGYLIASPQKKAILKEKLWLIAIGVFILAGGNVLFQLLYNLAYKLGK